MEPKSADVPRLLDALGIQTRDHGVELWGPCPHPDHDEKRPSWSIHNDPQDPANGSHYCFGCQFSGGPVDLVAAVRGISLGGARQWITDRGLWLKGSLPLAVRFEVTNRFRLMTLHLPSGLVEGPLARWPTPIRRYAESRGITAEQVERWELCFAVDGPMGGRIVFPVKDERGMWVGWHARTYCKQDKRYKNASRADGYDPGAIFGMRWWPPLEERGQVVLTEGALDALACERAGARFIAAIGGSEAHARQLLKLQTWSCILIATDGDHAGDAVFKTLKSLLGSRCRVLRVDMPRGKDAAAIQEEQLRELLCRARGSAEAPVESRGRSRRRRLVRR
jgi:DNA primase